MPLRFNVRLEHDTQSRLQLEYVPLPGDGHGFVLNSLTSGPLLKAYHKRAAHGTAEPARAIEVPSYETVAAFVDAVFKSQLVIPGLDEMRQNALSVVQGLSVVVDPLLGSGPLVGADVYLFDDAIGDPWIWLDRIIAAEAVYVP